MAQRITIPYQVGTQYTLNGSPVVQGQSYDVSGLVTVRAVQQQGYQFAANAVTQWSYDYSKTWQIVTSDSFSGSGSLAGRTTDAALGGTPMQWSTGADGAWVVQNGYAAPGSTPGWNILDSGFKDVRVEFDLVYPDMTWGQALSLVVGAPAGTVNGTYLDLHSFKVAAMLGMPAGSGVYSYDQRAPEGHYVVQRLGSMFSLLAPGWFQLHWDVTGSTYDLTGTNVIMRSLRANVDFRMKNLKIYKAV